jgi:hypothetical protein
MAAPTATEDRNMKAPDLQEWIARYGGYPNIPWTKWDAAVAAWQEWRREQLKREQADSARLRAARR